MSGAQLDPLTWNIRIVDEHGWPTQEFMRKWEQQIAANKTIVPLAEVQLQAELIAKREVPVGFGFYDSGTYKDNEQLGVATFGHSTLFPSKTALSQVTALIAATSSAVFHFKYGPSLTPVGTVTFAAGSLTGVIVWVGGFFVLPEGHGLTVFSPATADPTLAFVSGLVQGTREGA